MVRPPTILSRQHASARLFHTTRATRNSPLFNLGGLAASREGQYLARERGVPRSEFSSSVQLIRASEVDPFAPAPGAATHANANANAPSPERPALEENQQPSRPSRKRERKNTHPRVSEARRRKNNKKPRLSPVEAREKKAAKRAAKIAAREEKAAAKAARNAATKVTRDARLAKFRAERKTLAADEVKRVDRQKLASLRALRARHPDVLPGKGKASAAYIEQLRLAVKRVEDKQAAHDSVLFWRTSFFFLLGSTTMGLWYTLTTSRAGAPPAPTAAPPAAALETLALDGAAGVESTGVTKVLESTAPVEETAVKAVPQDKRAPGFLGSLFWSSRQD